MNNRDLNVKFRIAAGILIVLWMIVIFSFSAQPASESEVTSGAVSYRIIFTVGQYLDMDWNERECLVRASLIDHPVRKLAHMTEYAILAFFWFMLFWGCVTDREVCGSDKLRIYKIFAVIFSMLYACTDEFHQLFVAGRSGRITDVFIDTAGAFIGVMVTGFIIMKIIKHCENSKIPLQ